MKEFVRTLFLTIIVCCWSCSDGGEDLPTPSPKPETSKIEISSSAPVVEQKGGTATITFTTNAAWTANVGTSTSWLKVSPTSGPAGTHTLTVTTSENDTYDERNASITLKAGNASKSITVAQKQKDALIVTSNKVEIGSNGGEFSIEAKANVNVTYEIEKSTKDWISANESRGLTAKTLKFTAKANEEKEKRQGNIILKGGDGLSETITVYQDGSGPTLVITSDDIIVESNGETIKIEVKSNVDYTMTLPEVEWISKDASRAISTYTHYLSIAPNETYDQRSAVVYFQSETEKLKDSINITQVQKDAIIVAKNEYEVAPEGGKFEFAINRNVDFEISTSVGWIQQNVDSKYLTENSLSFIIKENLDEGSREGEICIIFDNLKQTIRVIQESTLSKLLKEFYRVTNGDCWRHNDNWLSDGPIINTWYGVHSYIHSYYGDVSFISLRNNHLSGSFPEVLGTLMDYFDDFDLRDNNLYGSIPNTVKNHPNWQKMGWSLIKQSVSEEGDLDLIESNLYIDNLQVEDLFSDETTVSYLYDIFKKNKLTQITKAHPTDDGMNIEEVIQDLTDNRVNQHLDYGSKGLATVIYTGKGSEQEKEELKNSLSQIYGSVEGITWLYGKTPIDYHNNSISYFFDQNGQLVYKAEYNANCPGWKHELVHERCNNFLRSYLGEPAEHPEFSAEIYTSTDYSRDGEVVALQEATVGQGINMVFLGEAYVDKDMESGGLYEQKMMEAMEAFFSVEPYKSMRERFNVYAVKVVSPNSIFGERGKQAINQNNKLCFEYANKIPNADKNPPMVTVVYRSFVWGSSMGRSHTYMYEDGSFVAYIICGLDDDSDVNTLIHESGGHGFAGLLDEYVESGNEELTLPEEKKSYLDNVWVKSSWGANVDWHNDVTTVKWSHFLNDARYADDGLGLYEGAYLYGHGAYRPTENSMMRHNNAPFNAPSREQIYKRIMQLSEGEGWKYDYEEFVKFDEKSRKSESRSTIKPLTEAERREYIKNHRPPTFIKGTWRDAINNGKNNIVVPLR